LATIQYYGTGKRKTAIARVFLRPGTGGIHINGRGFDEYFASEPLRLQVQQPLKLAECADKFDIHVNVSGGGASGQAGAVRHGISRALVEYNPEFRKKLRGAGFLTRDARVKERKKYGQPGARKRFQYSKR
jgi:small subunit ribosomal protein S9